MLGSLVFGIILGVSFMLLLNYLQKLKAVLNWWQWLLTVLGFIYAAFVLETIQAFLLEGAGQGAFIVGLILSLIAVIWGGLLSRFVFVPQKAAK
ncbi:hypothetical protein KQH40_00065 [bacterium]|nr:hypothetical protein [bacterium]